MPAVERDNTKAAFLTVRDLMRPPLNLGRRTAYLLAADLGIRVGRRRILIPKGRFDEWLATARVTKLSSPRSSS